MKIRKSSRIHGGNDDDPDALAEYLMAVKVAFQSNRESENSENSDKYDHIVKLITDFRAGRIHTRTVKVRVKELLYGHNDLILRFNAFLPKRSPITLSVESLRFHEDLAPFLTAVQNVSQDKRGNYSEFLELLKDYRDGRIDKRGITAKVKDLIKGRPDLILLFNSFLPNERQIILPTDQLETTGKKVKKVEKNCELPLDVLDIISKTLDFDDHFQFAGVCKNWRAFHKIYWRNFLASQEPLLLQAICPKRSLSFISIPNQKVYCSNMKIPSNYVTSSSGYLIIAEYTGKKFLLINPFTRIKKVINAPPSENQSFLTKRALLAFGKCSEEFVFVVLCKHRVHVYQSRNCGWVTYLTMENSGTIVDFVVFHNIIYVVTDTVNIGVLSLNSVNIKFLKLKNAPNETYTLDLRFVSCYEQLLVVDFEFKVIRNVFKVDLSTMSYVRPETLGDMALFCISNGMQRNCYALINPNRWGYESNYVYASDLFSTICGAYLENDKILHNFIMLPAPHGTSSHTIDWYFRHLRYEVDYYLVE